MRTFKVDGDNNFVIGSDGQIPIIGGIPAIAQTAKQYVQARREEMIYKYDEGIPFALIAWAADPNEAAFEVVTRQRLLQIDGVTAITAFEIVRVGDVLKYTATIDTTEGEAVING